MRTRPASSARDALPPPSRSASRARTALSTVPDRSIIWNAVPINDVPWNRAAVQRPPGSRRGRAVLRAGLGARAGFDGRAAVRGRAGPAWQELPSTYVICERDNAIPVFAQEAMSQRAREVRRLDAGHSPFLSRPDDVAALVRDVFAKATG
ncbi:alpha/beta fold hydrolase [Sorangium sp. So ce388]|uniref:alpha/beta fold hydrolase n=1 Tax=Sorangium sp. So ce388 TaxID=3133309 RepID=UPI003F5B4F19